MWKRREEASGDTALILDNYCSIGGGMYETFTYDDPAILPVAARDHWAYMESNSAAAVMKAVCPDEWTDIVEVLSTYRLEPKYWLKAGGNRGDIAEQIDDEFGKRGWSGSALMRR